MAILPPIEGRVLRPLGVGEVIDVSINLFTRNLGRLLLTAAAVVVPLTVIVFLLDMVAVQEVQPTDPNAALYSIGDTLRWLDESRLNLITGIEVVLTVLAYLVVVGATFRAVSEAYLGRSPDARASIGFAAGRAHSLLWVGILVMLGVGIGFLLLILPGIWLLIAWSLAVPALMVEGLRGTKAIGRSFKLVRKHWWRTFAAMLVGFVFIALIQFLIGLAASAFNGVAESSVPAYVALIDGADGLAAIVTAPLQAAIITVIYYDLRVRKEGFDVELLAQQLDAPAPARGAFPPAAGSGDGEPPRPTDPPAA